jgi:hypothetical protein
MQKKQTPELKYDEDYQTWEAYKHKENFRWLFNKLEVALRQGLHAGPAGTAPQHNGIYVHRPVYNVYGMGIGAKKFFYHREEDSENFINHAVVPPGHFWCEWLEGPHYSIDYQVLSDYKTWEISSIWAGEHYDETNLTKFKRWMKLEKFEAPNPHLLPLHLPWFGPQAQPWDRESVPGFNVEMRSGKIIEIHLRHGNDTLDHHPVGTVVTPVWEDMEIPEGVEFEPNLTEGMTDNGAHGKLTNVRRGFLIQRPNA